MKRMLPLIIFVLLSINVFATESRVALAWDPNEDGGMTVGYKLYYGPVSGSYTISIDVGNVTTYVVTTLEAGLYFFAVTAYSANHAEESGYSNEVDAQVPEAPLVILPVILTVQ